MKTDLLDLQNVDCMELMAKYPDGHFDLAIVDPPYGIGFTGRRDAKVRRANGSYGHTARKQHEKKKWDEAIPTPAYFDELKRVSKHQVIWGGNYFDLAPTRGVICWDKVQNFDTMSQWEMAWSSYDKPAKLFRYDNKGFMDKEGAKIHPTQKPVKLYEWILRNYAKSGDKILDTHMGSGSIAVACHYAGFHLTASELDAEYFQAACERIKRETAQQALFA